MDEEIEVYATSGYKDVTVANYIKLRFSWEAGTQNIANNYTPVTWKLQLISSNSSANISSSASKDYSVTVNGTTKSGTNTVGLSGGQTKTLASGSLNITHNADGTKTFSFSFSQEFAINYGGSYIGTVSGNGTGTLNTIPRGSVLGSISAFTLGNAITIPITKYSSSFTDTLTISLGGTTVKTVSNITNGASVSFTSSELNTIYGLLPSATSGTFDFKLTTKSGSTTIGTSTKNVKGSIPSSVKPSISSVTLAEAVSGLASQFGFYVQNKSKIKVTVNASAGTGSSIDSYKVVINGSTYTKNTFTTGFLTKSGSNSCSVTVTDKRGRTATSTTNFTVTAYAEPSISSFTVVRCNSDGTENEEGAYAKVNASASITSLSNKNTKTFKLQYKKKSDSSYTTNQTYTSAYAYNVTNKIISGISVDDAYDFKIVATDYFGTTEKSLSLGTAYTIMDIKANGKGIAFGKVSNTDDTLDIGYDQTYLPPLNYLGGKYGANSDAEKGLYFQTTQNAANPHNVKHYGGNAGSPVALGAWDTIAGKAIYQYFDGERFQFRFGAGLDLEWGSYDIEALIAKVAANVSGRIHLRSGLLIQWGSVNITPTAANTPAKTTIKFPVAYDYTPDVMVSGYTTVPGTIVTGVSHGADSATSTDIYLTRTNTAATTIRWLAIGYKEITTTDVEEVGGVE